MSTETTDLSGLQKLSPELIVRIFRCFLYGQDEPTSPDINCCDCGDLLLTTEFVVGNPANFRRERRAIMGQAIAPTCRFLHRPAVEALWASVTISNPTTLQEVAKRVSQEDGISRKEWRGPQTRVLHFEMDTHTSDYGDELCHILDRVRGLHTFVHRNAFSTTPSLYKCLLAFKKRLRLVRIDATNGVSKDNCMAIHEVSRLINAFPLRCLQLDCASDRICQMSIIQENHTLKTLCIGDGKDDWDDGRMSLLLTGLAENLPLKSLNELHVHKYLPEFRKFLEAYGPQLTAFTIDFSPQDASEAVGDYGHGLIDLCPRLRVLSCATRTGFTAGDQWLLPTSHAHLVELKLVFKHDSIVARVGDLTETTDTLAKGRFESLEMLQVVVAHGAVCETEDLVEWFNKCETTFGDVFCYNTSFVF